MFIDDYSDPFPDINDAHGRITLMNKVLEEMQKEIKELHKEMDILKKRMLVNDRLGLEELHALLDEVSPNQHEASRVFRLLVSHDIGNIDILASWDFDILNEFVKNTSGIGKKSKKILEEAVAKAKTKVLYRQLNMDI